MGDAARRTLDEALEQLSPEDRAWIDSALVEYRDALEYLREH